MERNRIESNRIESNGMGWWSKPIYCSIDRLRGRKDTIDARVKHKDTLISALEGDELMDGRTDGLLYSHGAEKMSDDGAV